MFHQNFLNLFKKHLLFSLLKHFSNNAPGLSAGILAHKSLVLLQKNIIWPACENSAGPQVSSFKIVQQKEKNNSVHTASMKPYHLED